MDDGSQAQAGTYRYAEVVAIGSLSQGLGGKMITNIQGLRFAAALGVAVLHVGLLNGLNAEIMGGRLSAFLIGGAGIDLFFVISGLITVVSSQRLFGRDAPPPKVFITRSHPCSTKCGTGKRLGLVASDNYRRFIGSGLPGERSAQRFHQASWCLCVREAAQASERIHHR
jgi:hypothetical protein